MKRCGQQSFSYVAPNTVLSSFIHAYSLPRETVGSESKLFLFHNKNSPVPVIEPGTECILGFLEKPTCSFLDSKPLGKSLLSHQDTSFLINKRAGKAKIALTAMRSWRRESVVSRTDAYRTDETVRLGV